MSTIFLTKTFHMRQPPLAGILTPFLLVFSVFICLESRAQSSKGINWNTDTVAQSSATTRATRFRSDLNNAGKKATRIFTLQVDKLKEIMDACYSHNVTEVKIIVVTIRADDTAHYSRRNPGLTATERKDLIGRQAIILKVPRHAFAVSGSGINIPNKNPLMISLITAGLIQMDKPIAGLPVAEADIYFEFGSICPPPGSCDN